MEDLEEAELSWQKRLVELEESQPEVALEDRVISLDRRVSDIERSRVWKHCVTDAYVEDALRRVKVEVNIVDKNDEVPF